MTITKEFTVWKFNTTAAAAGFPRKRTPTDTAKLG